MSMRQLSIIDGDQMMWMLATIGQHTSFNNEQTQYHIASFKRPPKTAKWKTIQAKQPTAWFMYKTMNENKYDLQEQATTTE